jgi:hypothetical protein
MNRFLTVVSSALVAALPVSAFAQPTTAQPAATAMIAKTDAKAPAHATNIVKAHHAAVKAPVANVQAKG